jgi:glycerol kinase
VPGDRPGCAREPSPGVRSEGQIVARGEREVSITRPQRDRAEQGGDELVTSNDAAVEQATALPGRRVADLSAAGLTSQRASAIGWHRGDGRPLSPVFSGQDRRMRRWIDRLQAPGAQCTRHKCATNALESLAISGLE